MKWHAWVEQESYKRLVHHLFEHDMLVTHAKHRQPVMSFAELLLPLPASRDLWLAPDAEAWLSLYTHSQAETGSFDISVHYLSTEDRLAGALFGGYDKKLLVGMKLSAIAAQVWTYQQMRSLSGGSRASADPSSELWTQARLQYL